ncbi:MAG: glycosyltransferase family 4 protein [Bacteroidetes bacterium]|nr:glycosyltransferase family 4 protein [Bacteroidota bacterium]
MEQFNLISIVPYKILPPTSGGHLGIVDLHNHLGKLCNDIIIGTADNTSEAGYSFSIEKVFPPTSKRYLPRFALNKIVATAKANKANAIYCDHPYMAFTAIALSKQLGIPWFMRSHNIESERFRTLGKSWWPIMKWFEGYTMSKANGVFFITPEDVEWAKTNYKLDAKKCHLVTYGTNLSQIPSGHDIAKQQLAQELNISNDTPLLYFLGALNYQPNIEAVQYILNEIMPRLDKKGIQYQMLIAGKGLSQELQDKIKATGNVRYMGFIPVLETFLNGCDIMLNPVMIGGGIKTKAVEALGYNKIVVSSAIGAAGLIPSVCGTNLHITPDHDWDAFANKVEKVINNKPSIPASFYETYYWGNITAKALQIMKQTII